jgi:hypothetical protein
VLNILPESSDAASGSMVVCDRANILIYTGQPDANVSQALNRTFSLFGVDNLEIINYWQSNRPDLFLGAIAPNGSSLNCTMAAGLNGTPGRMSSVGLDARTSQTVRAVSDHLGSLSVSLTLWDGSLSGTMKWTVPNEAMEGQPGEFSYHGTTATRARAILQEGFVQQDKQYDATPAGFVFFSSSPELAALHALNAARNDTSCEKEALEEAVVVEVKIPQDAERSIDYDAKNGWLKRSVVPVNDEETIIRETGLFKVNESSVNYAVFAD